MIDCIVKIKRGFTLITLKLLNHYVHCNFFTILPWCNQNTPIRYNYTYDHSCMNRTIDESYESSWFRTISIRIVHRLRIHYFNLFPLGSWWRLSFQKLTKTKNHSWKKERTFICFLCRLVVKIIYFFQDILLPLSVFDSKVFLLLPLSIGCCSVKLLNPFFFF